MLLVLLGSLCNGARANALGADFLSLVAVLCGNFDGLNIGVPAPSLLVVGVAYVIAVSWTFSAYFAL